MVSPFVALDFDGVVSQPGHRVDWFNPQSVLDKCRPMPGAKKRVDELVFAGWEPCFITKRNSGLFHVTFRQIRLWFGGLVAKGADVWDRVTWDEFDSDPGIIDERVLKHFMESLQAVKRYSETYERPCLVVTGDLVMVEAAGRVGVPVVMASEWLARGCAAFDDSFLPKVAQ